MNVLDGTGGMFAPDSNNSIIKLKFKCVCVCDYVENHPDLQFTLQHFLCNKPCIYKEMYTFIYYGRIKLIKSDYNVTKDSI